MPSHALHKLTAVQVRTLPPGKHADGGGLWLWKREDGRGQWVLRVSIHGRRREMGLGSLAEVTLREARGRNPAARPRARQRRPDQGAPATAP